MKKIYFILVVFIAFGCSKNEESVNRISTGNAKVDDLLYEIRTEIDKSFGENLHHWYVTDDTTKIFLSGKINNSSGLGIIGFNIHTKKKLFDLIQFEHSAITIELPYGESKTYNINQIIVDGYIENNTSMVITLKVGGGYYDPVRYIYFINDNIITEVNPSADNWYNRCVKLVNWNQNYLLINSPNSLGYPVPDQHVLYSSLGEKIITAKYNGSNLTKFDEINDYEAIVFGDGNSIRRIDLQNPEYKWWTQYELNNLDHPRIDEIKLESKNGSYFTYVIYYTEFTGSNGILKFKL